MFASDKYHCSNYLTLMEDSINNVTASILYTFQNIGHPFQYLQILRFYETLNATVPSTDFRNGTKTNCNHYIN